MFEKDLEYQGKEFKVPSLCFPELLKVILREEWYGE